MGKLHAKRSTMQQTFELQVRPYTELFELINSRALIVIFLFHFQSLFGICMRIRFDFNAGFAFKNECCSLSLERTIQFSK